jgi:hypothetical protein
LRRRGLCTRPRAAPGTGYNRSSASSTVRMATPRRTHGEHFAGAYGVDVESEEDEHRGRRGACAGGLDRGVDARILGLRDKAHPPQCVLF